MENVGNVRFMQKINRVKVLSHIRKNSPVSRNELSKVTGLSLSSITNIVNYLIDENLVMETGRKKNCGAGRRAALIEFNAFAMKIIAVNIETDTAEIALTDLSGGIISGETVEIPSGNSAQKTLEIIKKRVLKTIGENSGVKAMGIAASGYVSKDGAITSSIMGWEKVNVKEYFEKSTELPVFVTNNTKTKALWTIRALNDSKNIVFLDMSANGIGIVSATGGTINDTVAGELGHTPVFRDGKELRLENVCNIKYMLDEYKKLSGKSASCEEIYNEYINREPASLQVAEEITAYMSAALVSIIAIFEPDLITVNSSALFDMPAFYEISVKRALMHTEKLAMKTPEFKKVNIASNQSAQGAAQTVADILFGIDSPEEIL